MRLCALGAQGGALGHAEAVLLICDDHAEAGKAGLLREQGMCADDDVREAELRRLARAALLRSAHLPRQEHRADAETLKQRGEAVKMLPGQDLRRGQQRGLHAVFCSETGSRGGDHRLAAANIALHEPVHRFSRLHIAHSVRNGAFLRTRRHKRQA